MQEKEIPTRQRILNAAREVFLEKGYADSGLREIAAKAGVTTGALYGCFKGKEELFSELVGKQYRRIFEMYREMLTRFSRLPAQQQHSDMSGYTAAGINVITDYLYDNYDAFKLILCCSEGTEYSHLVHDMARLDVEATHEFKACSDEAGIPLKPVNPTLEHMLTSGMFSTYFELIVHDIPREEAGEYIAQMLAFYESGWAKIMGF